MPEHAPRIVVDFDGVLHSYSSGWQGAATIPDPPVEGAREWLCKIASNGWEIVIQSTRAATPDGLAAIQRWLIDNDMLDGLPVTVTAEKLPALVYLDDRALRFDGLFPSLEAVQRAAQPWNK